MSETDEIRRGLKRAKQPQKQTIPIPHLSAVQVTYFTHSPYLEKPELYRTDGNNQDTAGLCSINCALSDKISQITLLNFN